MIEQALEGNGARMVYIVGRRADILEKAAKTSRYGNITPFPGDVTDRARMLELVNRVHKDHGRLDVLVNAAGVMATWHKKFDVPDDGSVDTIQKLLMSESESDWAVQFKTNITAVYFLVGAFLSLMKASNDHWKSLDGSRDPFTARTAQVITVTGIDALSRKMGGCMGYVASKAGVLQLMKTLATVLAPTGVRFNSIAPGIFPSEITGGKGHLDDQNRNHLGPPPKTSVPQGRAGDVRDMAGATLFLCGRGGFYCNGAVVVMDGGRLSINPSSF